MKIGPSGIARANWISLLSRGIQNANFRGLRGFALDDGAFFTGEHTGFEVLDTGGASTGDGEGGMEFAAGAFVLGHGPTLPEVERFLKVLFRLAAISFPCERRGQT